MTNAEGKAKSGGWVWGLLAIGALLAAFVWQTGWFKSRDDSLDQAWFDSYADRYLSEPVGVTTSDRANVRKYPTSRNTEPIGSYPGGSRLRGRWVQGADPKVLWFKTADGYVWEGNLAGNRSVMVAASASAAAIASTPAPAPKPKPTAAGSTPAAQPSTADSADTTFDEGTMAAIRRAVGDPALAEEIIRSAELRSRDSADGRTLIWSICGERCKSTYTSTVLITGPKRRPVATVCLHDSATMGEFSEWYAAGREPVRAMGLCPSRLAAVKLP